MYVIQDHLKLVPDGLILKSESMIILLSMSRSMSMIDLKYKLTNMQGGVDVDDNQIDGLIRKFDDLFLLSTPKFKSHRMQLLKTFKVLDKRHPALAGKSYPEDPDALTEMLEGILDTPVSCQKDLSGKKIKAIVAPHIDLEVGRRVYGAAYRFPVAESVKRIVILGTGHHLEGSYFSITDKDFITPLGVLQCDREAVDFLRKAPAGALSYFDFDHRSEHSIEFQTLFVKHLIGDRNISVIPILCGSFASFCDTVYRPSDYLPISGFINALKLVVSDPGTLVIAGVDLSHVGPKFGDAQPAEKLMDKARESDEKLLSAFVRGDIHEFWSAGRMTSAQYHVCGYSCLATLLEIIHQPEGAVLDYEFWHESDTRSAVSYSATVLWEGRDDSREETVDTPRVRQIDLETRPGF